MALNTQKGAVVIVNMLPKIPKSPGIYKMLAKKEVLYVGKAKNLYNRLVYYTKDNLSGKTKHFISCIDSLEISVTQSEEEALLLEINLIKKYRPKYNILFKDDKSFAYIKIDTAHKFPKIVKYRSKTIEQKDLYGPFASGLGLKSMLTTLQKIFQLRNCSDYFFNKEKSLYTV